MVRIDSGLVKDLIGVAVQCERKRAIHRFHDKDSDLLQRMLNALEPETYVQPHKHEAPDKREAFIVLRGKLLLIEFDEQGKVVDHEIMCNEEGNFGAEVAPGVYHTIFALEPGTVCYELKDGPYSADDDKQFAPWAPAEGDSDSLEYKERLLGELLTTTRLP